MNQKKDWHLIEYYTPIEFKENVKEGFDDFIIKGVAINETTTHNGHKYIAEELQKASSHLIGKKLLVDHRNEVDAIKGIINNSWWNSKENRIEFEGNVKDKTIREMIKDGRLSDVSIGAFAKDLIKEEDGTMIAKGLEIVELSFVAVPADSKANFGMAMAQNFNIKESLNEAEDMKKCPECGKMISKDKMKKHMKDDHEEDMGESYNHASGSERRYGEMTEEKLQEMDSERAKFMEEHKKALEELTILRNERRTNLVNEYKKMCLAKRVKEKDVSNISEDMIKLLIEQLKDIIIEEKQLKSIVVEEDLSDVKDVIMERSEYVRGTAAWRMPNTNEWRKLHNNRPFNIK